MPDGVVNVLTSRKSGAVVSAMLNDPRVRKLSFTGSTEVGRILLREAADTDSELLDGARRQRAVHHLRRRGHRRRRRGGADRQDAQRRRGLHRGQPLLRARGGRRRVQPGLRGAPGPHDRRAGPGRGHRRRPAGQRADPDQGGRARRVRDRGRRQGGHRRAGAGPARLLLPADGDRPGPGGRGHPRHRDLRPGGARGQVHRRSRRDRPGPTTPSSGSSPTSTPAT